MINLNTLVIGDQSLAYDPKGFTLAQRIGGGDPRFRILAVNRLSDEDTLPDITVTLKPGSPDGISVETTVLKYLVLGPSLGLGLVDVSLAGAHDGQEFGFTIAVEGVGLLDPRVRVVPLGFSTSLATVQAAFPDLQDPEALRNLRGEIETALAGDPQGTD